MNYQLRLVGGVDALRFSLRNGRPKGWRSMDGAVGLFRRSRPRWSQRTPEGSCRSTISRSLLV